MELKHFALITSIFLLIFPIGFLPLTLGEKILFMLPMSSKSMANIFEPIAVALAERGHHLTIVTPTRFKISSSNKNVTQITPITVEDFVRDYPNPFKVREGNELYKFPVPWQEKYCNILYDNSEFTSLANVKFDLALFNAAYHDCFAGLLHKIGCPIIFVGVLPLPSPMVELFGNYLPSSFIPVFTLGDLSAQLNFRQRVKNFLLNGYFKIMMDVWTRPPMETLYRTRLGDPSLPSIQEIYKKQGSLIFQNAHFTLTNPRPLLPSNIEIGGIQCRPAKPLPKDLQEWADEAQEGLVIFSLGSIARATHIPETVRKAFVQTFGKLKQRVIWKWENEEGMADLPKNVKLVKWLPQQDVLGHRNVKLFITHGGLLSTEEAVYNSVPVLGFPIFVDQDNNMAQAEVLGFGIKAEILNLTETKLTPLIRQMLDDPRYAQKAKEVSARFRDQLNSPLDTAVYWTEYVLRHKGAYHLQSPGMHLNWLQYYCLDVIGFLVTIALLIILLPYYGLKFLLRLCCGKQSDSKSSKRSTVNKNKKNM